MLQLFRAKEAERAENPGPKKEQTKAVSMLSDPFSKSCISRVTLTWRRSTMFGETNIYIYSCVEFVNGSTKGEHEIKAETMDELFIKTKAFVESLPK